MTSDEKAVLRVLREQEAATARGDADAALAPVADDALVFDLPPPLQYRGAEGLDADGLRRWYETWENGVTVEMRDPQVLMDGDLAVVFGLSRMRGTKKGQGPQDVWSRRTVALRRREGVWRIVHEHGSFPTMMDGSGRSATELKP